MTEVTPAVTPEVTKAALFCIHGFLGSSDDWASALPAAEGWSSVNAADWLRDARVGEARDLEGFGDAINRWARESSFANAEKRVLLGYSMGGRIALHALLRDPGFWQSAVIVSAHPGLSSESERRQRLEQDLAWARRFRSENWESVLGAWNSQAVFAQDGPPLPRPETPGLRERLAHALDSGSLARQKDLRPSLARLELPVLWLAGGKDAKYSALARECAGLNPRFRFETIPDVGHRAPWSAGFQKNLRDWMNSLNVNGGETAK